MAETKNLNCWRFVDCGFSVDNHENGMMRKSSTWLISGPPTYVFSIKLSRVSTWWTPKS